MSTTVLQIIPINSEYIPDEVLQQKAEKYLSALFTDARIQTIASDEVEFIDQGEGIEEVHCNLCGESIALKDWQDVMDAAGETQYTDLYFVTACCGEKTSLNDLFYDTPAGFSKFALNVIEPEAELAEDQLHELQSILGVPLRIVWARY